MDEQNGFRSGRSCQDHIFVLDSIIRNRLAEDMPTFTAFIDLQKGFDCVNRDLLLNKILANGIDSKVFLGMVAHGRVVTSSRQITEVKQRRARLVFGWVTAARVTLPAMYRGVGQAFHIMPPLSTQQ